MPMPARRMAATNTVFLPSITWPVAAATGVSIATSRNGRSRVTS
jgi:hypothetical protein